MQIRTLIEWGTCVVSYTPFDADCFKYNAYVFTKSQINPFLNIYVYVLCYLRTILNNNNNKTFILKIGKCCTQMNVNTYNTQNNICINDILFSYNLKYKNKDNNICIQR